MVYSNQKVLYDALYHAASRTLNELSADKKYLGAKLGYICVLHTWGFTHELSSASPHHRSGGGLDHENHWKDKDGKLFFPVKVCQNEDQRTLGELFFFLADEMADITFSRSLSILMDALMASLQEILKLSDKQLTAFTADFEARLPEYLRNALHPQAAAA